MSRDREPKVYVYCVWRTNPHGDPETLVAIFANAENAERFRSLCEDKLGEDSYAFYTCDRVLDTDADECFKRYFKGEPDMDKFDVYDGVKDCVRILDRILREGSCISCDTRNLICRIDKDLEKWVNENKEECEG